MSIEVPNYKMFYKLRISNTNINWVVLEVDSIVLAKLKCAYCWTNAADSSIKKIPIEKRLDKNAFLKLYENEEGYPQRSTSIPESYPTNPQAEVLVLENIPRNFIKRLIVKDEHTKKLIIQKKLPTTVIIDDSKFKWRKDWEVWKNQGDV